MALGFVRRHPVLIGSLAGLLLLVALGLIFLPRGIHFALERWLERQGRISAEIENVDFNPLTGKLVVHTLIAQREEAPGRIRWERASFEIGWWPLLEQNLKLTSINLRDAVVTVRRTPEALYIGGLRIRTDDAAGKQKKDGKGWAFGFEDVDLYNVRVRYLDESFTKEILVEEAHIGAMAQWKPEEAGAFRARLKVAEGTLFLQGQASPFADQPSFDLQVKVDAVHPSWMQPWFREAGLIVEKGVLFADIKADGSYLPEKAGIKMEVAGSVRLEQARGRTPKVAVKNTQLSWSGRMEVSLQNQEAPLFAAEGTLESSGFDLLLVERDLAVYAEKANADLSFQKGTPEVPTDAGFLLDLTGTTGRISLSDRARNLIMASWDRLELDRLQTRGLKSFSLEQGLASNLRLLERPEMKPLPFYLQAAHVESGGLKYGGAGPLILESLQAQNLGALLIRNEQGVVLSPWRMPAEKKPKEKFEWPAIRLGFVNIGTGSRLLIRDRSLEPALRLDIDPLQIHVRNFDTLAKTEQPALLDIALEANGHPLSLKGEAQVSNQKIAFEGRATLFQWPVSLVQPYLLEKAYVENGLLSLNATIEGAYQRPEGSLDLRMKGSILATQVYGEVGGMRFRDVALNWTGNTFFTTTIGGGPTAGKPTFTADGEVEVPQFSMVLPEARMGLRGEKARIRADFALGTDAVPQGAPFLLQGGGRLASLQLRERDKELDVAVLRNMEIDGMRLTGADNLSAERLRIAGMQLLERPGETEVGNLFFLNGERAELENLQIAGPRDLAVAECSVQKLQGILVRDANGDFPFGKWLPKEKEEDKKPLSLRMGRFDINGGDSRLRYLDRSVDPFVKLELQPFNIGIQDLNLAEGRPSPLQMDGKFGRYSNLRLNGRLLSLQDKPSMDLLLEIEGLDMTKLTGYTEKLFGYAAKSGNLDVMADIQVREGSLEAQTDWKMTKLNLDAVDPATRQEINVLLGFSLHTGVALLRDGDGVIKLNIPVSGTITDPDFDYSDVIQRAILKGIRTAALGYLSPLGLAAKLGKELLLEPVFELRFQPVSFDPGQTQLSEQNRQHLRDVAGRLQKRPQVTIIVCGVAVPADKEGDPSEEELLQVARRRGENVRDYLTAQGIGPERLVQCAPDVDRSEGAEPRAEIGI
ncbi:MAG: DUF748 domain-containing protein [Syntrophotaleaceae bacterium]